MKTIQQIIDHYDFWSEPRDWFLISKEEWKIIRTALLANQSCEHARIVFSHCECKIKDCINPEMSHCDGKGEYTVVKSMGYRYCHQCNKRNCKTPEQFKAEVLDTVNDLKVYKNHGGDPQYEKLIAKLEEQLS